MIIPSLAKGSSAEFKVISGTAAPANSVEFQKDGSRLKAVVSGRPMLSYQTGPGEFPRENIAEAFRRAGYIHPLLTPSGKLVTDDYPRNHLHHHGVWWSWTKTEFQGRHPDFWNMGEKTGRGEFVNLDETWNGPVQAGFRAQHRFVDLTAPTPTAAIDDKWEVRTYASGKGAKFWIFDLTSTQTCATADPLKLPKYHYGGLGFRGNWDWNGKDKCFFLTSEGETDRDKGNFTRAHWCDIWGQVDGAPAGIAILSHPENFATPQPMRIHPTEPFFCYAPQQLGDTEITPGKPYVSRYRFIIHDGPADKSLIERLWQDFASPPKAEVGSL